MKGEDVPNIPRPTPNFGWPQNAKLGLELVLACSDLKLEDVRFISQCLGGGAGRHEDIWTGFRRRPERLVLIRVLMEWCGPEYRASLPGPPWNPSTAVLSSLAIPPSVKPHLKFKYLSPLGLISHGSEIFLSSSKISWRKSISYSTSLI